MRLRQAVQNISPPGITHSLLHVYENREGWD